MSVSASWREPIAWSPNLLRGRVLRDEVMDDPGLATGLHEQALVGLNRLNSISRAHQAVWRSIQPLASSAKAPLRVMDLACGDGELLKSLNRYGGQRLQLMGVDLSAVAIRRARKRTPNAIRYRCADVLRLPPLPDHRKPDVVVCCLFAHHLENEGIVRLLEVMKGLARRRVILNDIERSWLGWWSVFVGSRLLTRSPVVHVDSVRSVRASLTRTELLELSRRAGMNNALIRTAVPCRMQLVWDSET